MRRWCGLEWGGVGAAGRQPQDLLAWGLSFVIPFHTIHHPSTHLPTPTGTLTWYWESSDKRTRNLEYMYRAILNYCLSRVPIADKRIVSGTSSLFSSSSSSSSPLFNLKRARRLNLPSSHPPTHPPTQPSSASASPPSKVHQKTYKRHASACPTGSR